MPPKRKHVASSGSDSAKPANQMRLDGWLSAKKPSGEGEHRGHAKKSSKKVKTSNKRERASRIPQADSSESGSSSDNETTRVKKSKVDAKKESTKSKVSKTNYEKANSSRGGKAAHGISSDEAGSHEGHSEHDVNSEDETRAKDKSTAHDISSDEDYRPKVSKVSKAHVTSSSEEDDGDYTPDDTDKSTSHGSSSEDDDAESDEEDEEDEESDNSSASDKRGGHDMSSEDEEEEEEEEDDQNESIQPIKSKKKKAQHIISSEDDDDDEEEAGGAASDPQQEVSPVRPPKVRKRINLITDSDEDGEDEDTASPKQRENNHTEDKTVSEKEDESMSELNSSEDDEGDDVNADEYQFNMQSKDKIKETIVNFMNECALVELVAVKGLSKAKAQKFLDGRPYTNISQVKKKIVDVKASTNFIQELIIVIRGRRQLHKLISHCEELSNKMREKLTIMNDQNLSKECNDKDFLTVQPALLTKDHTLKGYQLKGVNWMNMMHSLNINGILADEMGLGKTIQTIAFLAHLLENGDPGPHLIIVPASTFDNWLRELNTWCPALKVLPYRGSQADRADIKDDLYIDGDKVDFNVMLCNYTIATRLSSDRKFLKSIKFQYAIYDEGHMLKNVKSLRYKYLMNIRTERRVLLTGTPLQNNLLELMSLLIFLMPKLMVSVTDILKTSFVSNREGKTLYETSMIKKAKHIMKPFYLRRCKSEVLSNLADKVEIEESIILCEDQRNNYNEILRLMKEAKVETENKYGKKDEKESGKKGEEESGKKGEEESGKKNGRKNEKKDEKKYNKIEDDKTYYLGFIMKLRNIANHPLNQRKIYTDERCLEMAKLLLRVIEDGNLQYILEDLKVLSDHMIHTTIQKYDIMKPYLLTDEQICRSDKFDKMMTLFEKYQKIGSKIVIFSQFAIMLDIMVDFLRIKGIKNCRLDGSVPQSDRLKIIDDFNQTPDIFIMLVTTRAGGLGINLTSANVVILHDLDHNPYNDKQAMDRCHRMGQTKTVYVHRLICKDTIDEDIFNKGKGKLELEREITSDPNHQATGEDDKAKDDITFQDIFKSMMD